MIINGDGIYQDTNDFDWELELTGMRKPATCGGIYMLKNGQDTNINFFKNDEDFDNTIYNFLNETRQEFRYKKGRRKINYLKEQGKIK